MYIAYQPGPKGLPASLLPNQVTQSHRRCPRGSLLHKTFPFPTERITLSQAAHISPAKIPTSLGKGKQAGLGRGARRRGGARGAGAARLPIRGCTQVRRAPLPLDPPWPAGSLLRSSAGDPSWALTRRRARIRRNQAVLAGACDRASRSHEAYSAGPGRRCR